MWVFSFALLNAVSSRVEAFEMLVGEEVHLQLSSCLTQKRSERDV